MNNIRVTLMTHARAEFTALSYRGLWYLCYAWAAKLAGQEIPINVPVFMTLSDRRPSSGAWVKVTAGPRGCGVSWRFVRILALAKALKSNQSRTSPVGDVALVFSAFHRWLTREFGDQPAYLSVRVGAKRKG